MRLLTLFGLFVLALAAHGANNATFVSQSVPSAMVPGQVYAVSVTMQNNGTTTWTTASGYKLGTQNAQDNTLWTGTTRRALPSGASIAPGQSVTFSFNVTAPSTPGTYNFQWKMLQESVEWFGALSTNVAVKVGLNDAAFASQNVPPVMQPGQSYAVTVTMNNNGGKTWATATSHRLGSQNAQDNTTWGTNRVNLAASVTPGNNGTFSFNVTAPSSAGTYNFQWKMVQDGVEWFGAQSANQAIKVGLDNAAFVGQSVPSVMVPGQVYAVSVTMQNTGSTTWPAGATVGLGSQNPAGNTTWGSSKVNLPSSVAPSAQATFNFNVTAPTTPGTYNFQWKMVEGSNGWFGAQTTNIAVDVNVAAPATNVYFIHTDHLNTPRLVANSSGTTVWRWEQQEPFGVNAPDENPSGLGNFEFALRFPGQYADKETNLFYNYFRDYDPIVGRYAESDPIGLLGGVQTYGYALGAPLQFVDPTGEYVWISVIAIASAAYLFAIASTSSQQQQAMLSQNSANKNKGSACEICEIAGPGGSSNLPDPCQMNPAHPNCPKNSELGGSSPKKGLGVTNPSHPKPSAPTLPSGVTKAEFGQIIGWGSGPQGAARCRAALSSADIERIRAAGISRQDISAWNDFYQNVFARNANNLAAQQRGLLLQQILTMW